MNLNYEVLKKLLVVLIVLATFQSKSVTCYRILGIFPTAGKSHYILGNALMKGLAEAGHDVTMVSPFEEKEVFKKGSYRSIVLTGFKEEFAKRMKDFNLFDSGTLFHSIILQVAVLPLNELFFNHTNVQKLFNSKEEFDAVIVEQFMVDAMKIMAHRFNAPLIAFSSIGPTVWVNGMTGNPTPLAYVPHVASPLPYNMSFGQKITNVFLYVLNQLLLYLYTFPRQDAILQKYFKDPPSVVDMYHNKVSLVLLNSHESMNPPVPIVPNMVQIGGFHVKPPKELPKDLKEYLDGAKDGAILFSFGSNLKSTDLPIEKRDAFLKAFSKLKQKVLWKWEDEVLPGQPPNVKLSKWLPQQDVLAHPNVKLFITHAGLLSISETVYNGVPILAIPVFGDQPINANLAVLSGYALSMHYNDPEFSEEKLSSLLHELLQNPKYKENILKRSQVYHDRQVKPMDNAVYWVEYVVRHKGAPHLRVAGADLSWYQYLLLDVLAVISAVVILIIILLYILIRKLCKSSGKKLKTN